MADKRYPVGTKIRFKCGYGRAKVDNNKIGRIVGIERDRRPLIVLPESTHESVFSTNERFVTWHTFWYNLVPLQKNEQLLFAFMGEAT